MRCGFKASFVPHPMHYVFADAEMRRELAATPLRRPIGGLLACRGQNTGAQGGRQYAGRLAGMISVQPVDAVRQKTLLPTNNGRSRGFELLLDGAEEAPSASIKMSRARNTYPAGRERNCEMAVRSPRWDSVSINSVGTATLLLTHLN